MDARGLAATFTALVDAAGVRPTNGLRSRRAERTFDSGHMWRMDC